MFVTRPIKRTKISAMTAAASASTMHRPQRYTTRASTSVKREGTPASSRAGPNEGETGRPSVVDAFSTSPRTIRSPLVSSLICHGCVALFQEHRRGAFGASVSVAAGPHLLQQLGQVAALVGGKLFHGFDEPLLRSLRRFLHDGP